MYLEWYFSNRSVQHIAPGCEEVRFSMRVCSRIEKSVFIKWVNTPETLLKILEQITTHFIRNDMRGVVLYKATIFI